MIVCNLWILVLKKILVKKILVKNLSDKDFKYLIEESGSEYLELLKQKGAYPYEYMNNFERFNEEKLPPKNIFIAL